MGRTWSGRRYDTGRCVEVHIEDGIIQAIKPIPEEKDLPWVSAGWIDLQVNGFGGFDLNSETTSVRDVIGVTKAIFKTGVASYLPTVITGSAERIEQALATISLACAEVPEVRLAVPGVHLEGPYLSSKDGPRGAHDKTYIRDPNWDEFQRWQEAAEGKISLVTLAPERHGAPGFIRKLAEPGIVVSIGHTMASTDEIEAAVAAGASMSTHLGNGAHPVLPRHPNYIWDQLANDQLQTMLIADGQHLPMNVLKAMIRAKRDAFIIVSDCVKFGGMPPGRYTSLIGGEVDLLENGRLQTAANPAILAGSASGLDRGAENVLRYTGISLKEAIDAVTVRPAAAMGFASLGRLDAGAAGNLTLFKTDGDRNIQVCETVLAGETVYAAGFSSD